MKRGSKKTDKDVAGSREPEEAGSKKTGGDDSGSFKATREMIGGDPEGVDIIRVFQMITGGIIVVLLIWVILHNILHII
jgi:hypothetical protein